MKKSLITLMLFLALSKPTIAESYYFKECKLSDAVKGHYIINLDKGLIEVTLIAINGTIQKFEDKIKKIEKDQIISEKIKSGKGDDVFFEYYLNSRSQTVTKLQYKKESGIDMDMFRIQSKKESICLDVKTGWDKDKIEKAEIDKEQEQILEAQKKIKDEQSTMMECEGDNFNDWDNCKGRHIDDTGHKYIGLFKDGKIIKGKALFLGGAKYAGEFKNYKPHGYGTFIWANGDKYFGEWSNGEALGNGTKIWKDGRKYLGKFKNDKLHGEGTLFYPDGKKYVGEFIRGKRHGEGTFTYSDGTAYIGKFIDGKEQGEGECISKDGLGIPCVSRLDPQIQDFSGKDTRKISIESKKWVRISQYENNTKRGKKVMDKLKKDFEAKALELCSTKGSYNVLQKNIEVLDSDETPAYGLETKLRLGISGIVECK